MKQESKYDSQPEIPEERKKSWQQSMRAWTHPRVVTMLFFGFSAGIPILLIFSSLSLWLREAGVSRSAVTFFSWAALGYSFKFVWAPLVDTLPLPLLTKKLGRRRSWLLFAQVAVITAICLMALTDPAAGQSSMVYMALAAVMLGFSSATQDIVIDAYRIECAPKEMQALLSSTYIAGYRLGMLVAGAGALYLASWFGTSKEAYSSTAWQYSYLCMAAVMLVGVATTLLIPEPAGASKNYDYPAEYYLRFLFLFICTVGAFVAVFFLTGDTVKLFNGMARGLSSTAPETPGPLVSFLSEAARLIAALFCALFTAFTGASGVTIVALGGFGSVPGAFFAALVVGLITEIPGFWDFLTYTLEMDWMFDVPMTSFKYMWIYVAYFIIMVVRPRGLFGWKH